MKRIILLIILCTSIGTTLSAQEYSEYHNLSEPQNQPIQFGINLRATVALPAPGIEFAAKFSPKFTLRGGVDFLKFSRKGKRFDPTSISVVDDFLSGIESEVGYRPNIDMKAKYRTLTGHAIVDYYPFSEKNNFFVSAGLYFGSSNLDFQVMMINPNTGKSFTEDLKNLEDMPEVEIIDFNDNKYVLRPTDEGQVILNTRLGNSIKPYVGFGFGQSVPKNRVGVRFEVGTYYSGKIKLDTPNITEGDINQLVLLGQDYVARAIYWSRWIPVMSVGLTIRL